MSAFTSNEFSDNPSVIGRMANLLNAALMGSKDKKGYNPLPKIIVIVPDQDIISCLDSEMSGLSKSYGRLVRFIMTEYERGVISFKENLPAKSKKDGYPHFLWIQAPLHDKFPNNNERVKFNHSLEEACKLHCNMSTLELKKVWNIHDENLYSELQNKITSDGYIKYWDAVDKTVRYCDSVALKKKALKNSVFKPKQDFTYVPNRSQNDKFRWHNPQIKADVSRFKLQRRLPSPPGDRRR